MTYWMLNENKSLYWLKRAAKHDEKSQKKMGFPSIRFILVSCSHPTKYLDEGTSVVVNLGPGFRADWETA